MKKAKLIILLLLSSALAPLSAQVAVSYYPLESTFSISSDTEQLLWADLRLETNTFIGLMNTEVQLMCNWRRSKWLNYYSGLGFNFKPFYAASDLSFLNAYVLSTGIRLKPWQAQPGFQVIVELAPFLSESWDAARLRSSFGVAYNF
jgi:hypothetical protein